MREAPQRDRPRAPRRWARSAASRPRSSATRSPRRTSSASSRSWSARRDGSGAERGAPARGGAHRCRRRCPGPAGRRHRGGARSLAAGQHVHGHAGRRGRLRHRRRRRGDVPGAAVPFGLTQFSPDTTPASGNLAGGYEYTDDQIRGFSLTHFSGAGCALLRDIPVLPTTTPVTASPAVPGTRNVAAQYVPEFDHAHESAAPGRYHVVLDPGTSRAIASDLTATTRTADGRFAFPATRNASVLLGAGGSALADGGRGTRIRPGRPGVTAACAAATSASSPRPTACSSPPGSRGRSSAYGTWRRDDAAPGRPPRPATAIRTPPTTRGPRRAVRHLRRPQAPAGRRAHRRLLRLRRRRPARSPGRGRGPPGAALRRSAAAAWRSRWAGCGSRRDRAGPVRDMATSLYHALVGPNVSTDVDGRYTGMDGRVHRAAHGARYANVSGWDIYRTQSPLMALLAPGRASTWPRRWSTERARAAACPAGPTPTSRPTSWSATRRTRSSPGCTRSAPGRSRPAPPYAG